MLLTNYLRSAWRNIFKHKLFSAINILGLAIGLASCILIALFVRDELSYDSFWTKADNIYRIHITFSVPGRDPIESAMTPGPVIHALKKDFPQVTHASRISRQQPTVILGDQYFVDDISLVDADFAAIFDLDVVAGNIDGALDNISNIVLNETLAEKYFSSSNPIGQTVTIDFDLFQRDYTVAAVIKDMAENSQVIAEALIPIDEPAWQDQPYMFDAWFSTNSQLYFATHEGTNIADINDNMVSFVDRNFPEVPFGGADNTSDLVSTSAMNIKDLHLKSNREGEYHPTGNMNTVVIFATVAGLILVIAAINFMNLSTARASQRAKEVSLRKVMGASRKDLVIQFLGESILLTILGLLISLAIVEMALPTYNEILDKELAINYASNDILGVIFLAFAVGFMGGIYPAFILSGFRPAENLKANQSVETSSSVKLRYALVILQFAVSITLFVSTAVVYGQMLYAKNMDLGFKKDNILAVGEMYRDVALEKMDLLLTEIRRMPQAVAVSTSNFMPGYVHQNNTIVHIEGQSTEDAVLIGNRSISHDYFTTYQVDLVAGREYNLERGDRTVFTSDLREGNIYTGQTMINESAVRRLGLGTPEEAIGKLIFAGAGQPEEGLTATYEVIGVVPDVHFDSLKSTIRPEIYDLDSNYASILSARFTGDPETFFAQVKALWEREIPSIPFDGEFVAEAIDRQYQAEQGQASMFAAFSGLAIFIACLGLYGLASFTAERRTKEIGIRKVMGASVFEVVKLLVWQFSKPVIIANLLAWPISFYAMSVWLENFVYRIEVNLIIAFCLMAGVTALIIAWGTVASNSMRVAKANPVNALRYE